MTVTKSKIMVVEDECIVARDIEKCLGVLGYETTEGAASGKEAFEKAEKFRPDLVMMDIRLKGDMDGIETSQLIGSRLNIPVIYLTAYSDDGVIERAKVTQPFGFIKKPFDYNDLKTGIELALYKHKQTKTLNESPTGSSTTAIHLREGVVLIDLEGKVIFINPGAEILTGWSAQTAKGKPAKDILNLVSGSTGNQIDGADKTTLPESSDVVLLTHLKGKEIPVKMVSVPIQGTMGGSLGTALIFQNISELEENNGSLNEEMARLKETNADLENFALLASHDLQAPLRRIISLTEMLATGYTPTLNNDGTDYISRIQKSVHRMRNYINDILTYSRLNHGKRYFESVDLNTVLAEAIEDLDEYIVTVGGTVTVAELPRIDANPFQLQRLFTNLISNALKFHKINESPHVNITCRKTSGGAWEITISDNGIGLDEKFASQIFQLFERLHGAGSFEGTGIGLAICKKIALDHGGDIIVKSSPGKGAAFIVTLPEKQEPTQ